MQYDPIKKSLGKVFNATPNLRVLFYKLLNTLLLRTWHVKRALKEWRKSLKTDDISILDAGSGFGQYSYLLSGMNKKWIIKGVDVKQDQIDDCNVFFAKKNRKNASFEYTDLTQLNEENRYNLIVSIDVMEHILEDQTVFNNFSKAMKKGGMLLISTPSDKGGSDVHDHEEDSSFIDEHVRDGYNIEAIKEQLIKAKFSKVEAKYTYGPAGKISWRLSMKYPIQMLNISKVFFILLPFYYIITMPFALILNCIDVSGNNKEGTGLLVKAYK